MLNGHSVMPMNDLYAEGTIATFRKDATLNARKLLADAEVIVGVDQVSGDEHVVFGRDRIGAGDEAVASVLRVGIDARGIGITALVRAVEVVKGRHEYRVS